MLYLSWLWYSLVLFARQETHSDTFDGEMPVPPWAEPGLLYSSGRTVKS